MALRAPNTVCKNRNCTKGKDGGRKIFYSCKYCVHTMSRQSVACSDECYEEYLAQIAAARAHGAPLVSEESMPERIDMTPDEVFELIMETETEEVIAETEEELADEMSEFPECSYGMIVERINEELNAENEEGDA